MPSGFNPTAERHASLPPDERARTGKLLNSAKQKLEAALEARQQQFASAALDTRLQSEWIDLTLPARQTALQIVWLAVGIALARIFDIRLFHAFRLFYETDNVGWDYLLTGLLIGGGSAPVHVLIKFISERRVPAEAEDALRHAAELDPTLPDPVYTLAVLLWQTNRPDEAAAQAGRAQRLDPASPFVNTWAAGAYFHAGRTGEAIASSRKALELDPAFADASLVLARTLLSLGRHGEAVGSYDQALAILGARPGALAELEGAVAGKPELSRLVMLDLDSGKMLRSLVQIVRNLQVIPLAEGIETGDERIIYPL